jgi:hypothetical protein
MADYRCYLISLSGSIWAAHDIACADDEAAIAKAKELCRPHKVEVWLGRQCIYPRSTADATQSSDACG